MTNRIHVLAARTEEEEDQRERDNTEDEYYRDPDEGDR